MYYGFPIFILGYQDQTYGYNVTTCSSSYSLGDWLVFGVGSKENAADQIKHYQKFTVNIPDESFILQMEQAGFISHRVLEAMACGTPVITSQTSAMPEIAGKDAILVNPYNPEEIAQAMVRLEEDPEYRHSLSQYGLRRVQRFSWKKTALKTLELYNEIIQQ